MYTGSAAGRVQDRLASIPSPAKRGRAREGALMHQSKCAVTIFSSLPPAKPGDFLSFVSRSKRLNLGRLRDLAILSHLMVAPLSPKLHLLQPPILSFLMPDVLPGHFLVPTHRRNKLPSSPKRLPHVVPTLAPIHSRQVNRALAFDIPHHLRYRSFGGIEIMICTWSGIRCSSSIWLSH